MSNPWTGPGIILTCLNPRPSHTPSSHSLQTCSTDDYTPRLRFTGAKIDSTHLYKAASPTSPKQHVLVTKITDLSALQNDILVAAARSQNTEICVDQRVFPRVQVYETSTQPAGMSSPRLMEGRRIDRVEDPAPTLIIAMMAPSRQEGGAADLDAWYRTEHNRQMGEQKGWRGTLRYGLLRQSRIQGLVTDGDVREDKVGEDSGAELTFLAVHEFEQDNELGSEVRALEPVSEWTERVMREAEGIDAGIFELVGQEQCLRKGVGSSGRRMC